MNAFAKYLLYWKLARQLHRKSVAVKQIDSAITPNLTHAEWSYDKYVIKSFKCAENYWTHVNEKYQTIATFTGACAVKLYWAAYWLAIAQAPSNATRAKMQIDRKAIDFAFDEISKSR